MISLLFRIWGLLVSLNHKFQLLLDGEAAIQAQLALIIDTLIPGPAVKLVFTAHLDDGTSTEVTKMELRDDQQVLLTIQPVDAKGKPAVVDGAPTWASSDETVVTLVPSADGMSAMASGVSPGTGRVVVTADADLGSGVTPLSGSLDFSITAGNAVSITITPGTPANQGSNPTP